MNLHRLVLFALVLIGSMASAQTTSDGTGYDTQVRVKGMRGARSKKDQPAKPGPGKLVGHCRVLAGNGNMIESPCVNLLLILNDSKGTELVRTRTDKNGEFTFESPTAGEYRVSVGTRFYEVAAPTGVVHSGQQVDLQLKAK